MRTAIGARARCVRHVINCSDFGTVYGTVRGTVNVRTCVRRPLRRAVGVAMAAIEREFLELESTPRGWSTLFQVL